jgi:predicted ATPase
MIRRIKIKNFRSLDVDFQLDPVTVLIGRSGTGKTNFVSALRFLREILKNGLHCGKQNEMNIFPLTRNIQEIGLVFEIEFNVPPLSEQFRYQLAIATPGPGIPLRGTIVSEAFFIDDNQVFCINPQKHEYLEQCKFSTFQGNQKVSIARIALTQGLACYDFPGSVCIGVGQNAHSNEGLADRAENYSTVFNAISKDLTKLESWNIINRSLQNLNATVETISFNSQNEHEILVTHKFGDLAVAFDIGKESEGFRRFFAHLLAVYQTPPKQTLVFEEPERGIHPGALESLAEILKLCPEEGHGQVILTTHSPQLLDYFDPESIRVVVMEEDGVTKIGPIEEGQLSALKKKLLFPGELLTVIDAEIAQDTLAGMASHVS